MRTFLLVACLFLVCASSLLAAEPAGDAGAIASALKALEGKLVPDDQRQALREGLGTSLREEIRAANRRSTAEWRKLAGAEDWKRYCDEKIGALKKSLVLPARSGPPKTLVTGEIRGEGFIIKNLCYVSRPGLVVTANLYVPDPPRPSMPAIILSHSHHNPKWEGELQDMGMTWARAGCYVLSPDHLGHGERRQHPFATAADFDKEFPVSRQDYHFRYDTSVQLYLVGESLMGWLAHDLMTGVDVLLAQPGADPKRLAILGAVAGGGDPSAVTAAVDERITCLVPFNFGGPQPESRVLTIDEAEEAFNYAGGGSWESTRNIRLSAGEGFLPWVIVGSVAPRYLIHAHEFRWDRETDPVWRRYQTIFGWFGAGDKLAATHGHGTLTSKDPVGSHCNNIGPVHRKAIHEAFRQWFAIDVNPEQEYKNRRTREELTCLTDKAASELKPQKLHELLAARGAEQIAAARKQLPADPAERRRQLVKVWAGVDAFAPIEWRVDNVPLENEIAGQTLDVRVIEIRQTNGAEATTAIARAVQLTSKKAPAGKRPLVVAVAAGGAEGFLKHRSAEIAELLAAGNSVALIDVSGTGALSAGDGTSYAATQFMLGGTLLGRQLRDLKAIVNTLLLTQDGIDPTKITVWGDSFVPPLAADTKFKYPKRVDRPRESEPTGPLLAFLLALSDETIAGVRVQGGLVSYQSVLENQYVQFSLANVVPGVFQGGDLPDVVAALAPRKVELTSLVDACNCAVPAAEAQKVYAIAAAAYEKAGARDKLQIK
jgi:dienelactone hydrolase